MSTSGAWPVTVSVSSIAPTVMSAFTVATNSPRSSMPSRLTVVNPGSVNVTVYGPGRRSTMRYRPWLSVTAVLEPAISAGLLASTVTPGSTAPEVSLTTPVMLLWAHAAAGSRNTHTITNRAIRWKPITVPLFKNNGLLRLRLTGNEPGIRLRFRRRRNHLHQVGARRHQLQWQPVSRQPRFRVHEAVIDRDGELEGVLGDTLIALGHLQRRAVRVARVVDPGAVVQTDRFDDERGVVLPASHRVPVPPRIRFLRQLRAVGPDDPPAVLEHVEHEHLVRRVHDLERPQLERKQPREPGRIAHR